MKIEIHAPDTPTGGYKIYKQGELRPVRNYRNHITCLYEFDENDVFNLLENKYKSFESGKYQFNITVSRLQLITGERTAQTRQELLIYP